MGRIFLLSLACSLVFWTISVHAANAIIHDAEYAIIEAQNGKAWAADDKAIDKKLAEIRKKNGGKPPNIVYILLDDVGFGEIGMDNLSVIRGYKTPNMVTNRLSDSLLSGHTFAQDAFAMSLSMQEYMSDA
jgi:hypothetical protein